MSKASLAGDSPFLLLILLLIGALSFAVALSWNDMAKAFVHTYVKESNTFRATFYYALIMTTILVVVGLIVAKFTPKVYNEL